MKVVFFAITLHLAQFTFDLAELHRLDPVDEQFAVKMIEFMKKIKVAFFDTKPYDRKSFDAANGKFGFELTYFETRLNPASARMAEGFDAVCAFVNDDIGAKTIEVLAEEKIQMIAMRCAGYNNVDLAAAWGKMVVVRVPGYSPYAVAEYALAMYMTLNRALHRAYNRVRENNFSINGLIGSDLRGKTVGIVGTGRIGQVFAEILQGYGVRILAHDMSLPGIFAYRSILKGGAPMQLPDFRNPEQREPFRTDNACTDPEVAGDQLLPSCSSEHAEIPDEVYEKEAALYEYGQKHNFHLGNY